MPDFNSREERLELKLQWSRYRIESLQDKISTMAPYLLSMDYHLKRTEYHASKVQELKEYIGLDLGEIYQELEALKNL
jgi:hypothetical protein